MPFNPVRMNPQRTLQLPSTDRIKGFIYQTFEIVNVKTAQVIARHTLLLNPTDMQQTEKARTSVTHTLGGAYVDNFGRGLPSVTIQGTQGWRARQAWEGFMTDGFEAFRSLRNNIYRYFLDSGDPDWQLRWYNWEDEEYYAIMPDPSGFNLQRNAQQPLLYQYSFTFTCLSPLVIGTPIGEQAPIYYYTTAQSIMANLGNYSQTIRATAAGGYIPY